jgi:glycosyltransferase involved in cell wall biosynthesis
VIRVAFPLPGGADWTGTGIHNYLLNLMRVLTQYSSDRVQPVLFVGADAAAVNIDPFASIPGLQVVRAAEFNDARKGQRFREALLAGCDRGAARCFREHGIDVLFENAQFYGWRCPIATVAWIPDFQHRHLKELFSLSAYWKRDLGFRAQMLGGRHIMLSSEDSRRDCENFFPQSIGRTSVVRFAVLPPDLSDDDGARATADQYKLPKHFFYLPNQFWKHKNHCVVIEALHLLKQQGHEIVVAATGKPDDYRHRDHYEMLRKLVALYGLEDNFRFLGTVPRQHVFALMRTCVALVNPSLFEGWSSTVEEAKSLGVPMLLSNLGVHVEQAESTAHFFDPHAPEQLAVLMVQHQPMQASSRQKAELLASSASLNRVKQFAIEFSETLQRVVALFERV